MNDPRNFRVSPIEKAIGVVFPKWAWERTKHKMHMFRYDGARYSTERYKPGFQGTQNPEAMQNVRDRINMMWALRGLAENNFVVQAILLKLSAYTFGSVMWQPRTGNLKVDRLVNDWVRERSKRVDVTRRIGLARYCRNLQRAKWRDGDVGNHNLLDEVGDHVVQPIEADRIGHPLAIARYDPHYASGMILDDWGRVIGVRVYQRLDSGLYCAPMDIPGENFDHLTMMNRFDQYRGVTAFHACIDTVVDLAEILNYENLGVKWASSITGLVEKEGGDAAEDSDLQLDVAVDTVDGKKKYIEKVNAGEIRYTDPGEAFKQLVGMRPSDGWQRHFDRLVRNAAACTNTSFGFIYDCTGLNGNGARLESVQMQRCCEIEQKEMEEAFLDGWKDQQIAIGVEDGELPDHPNILNGRFIYAAHPTIDVGRESQANLNENRQGLKSASDIYAEQGRDVFQEQEQIANEAANIVRLAKKKGVPVAMIQTLASNGRSDAEPMSGGGAGGGMGPSGMPDTTGRLIDSIGIGGTQSLLTVVAAVGAGTMTRESGVHTLMTVFGVDQASAETIIPAMGSSSVPDDAIPAVPKIGMGGGAGAPQKKPAPDAKTQLSLPAPISGETAAQVSAILEEMKHHAEGSPEHEYLRNKLLAIGG